MSGGGNPMCRRLASQRGAAGRKPGGRGKVVVRAGLSFRVYLDVPSGGVRKRPELRQTAARNPRFEREVKFAPYSACVIDRSSPVERDPVRRSNLPSKEKSQQINRRGKYRGAGQDSLR